MKTLTYNDYIAYKAFQEDITLQGYENPKNLISLVSRAGSSEEALELALKLEDLETLISLMTQNTRTKQRYDIPIINEKIPENTIQRIKEKLEQLVKTPQEHSKLASAYKENRLFEDAIKHYKIANSPEAIPLLKEMERFAEASQYAEKLSKEGITGASLDVAAELAMKNKDFSRANQLFKEANVLYNFEAAQCAKLAGDIPRAIEVIRNINAWRKAQTRKEHMIPGADTHRTIESLVWEYGNQGLMNNWYVQDEQVRGYYCHSECPQLNEELAQNISIFIPSVRTLEIKEIITELEEERKKYQELAEKARKRNIFTRIYRKIKYHSG